MNNLHNDIVATSLWEHLKSHKMTLLLFVGFWETIFAPIMMGYSLWIHPRPFPFTLLLGALGLVALGLLAFAVVEETIYYLWHDNAFRGACRHFWEFKSFWLIATLMAAFNGSALAGTLCLIMSWSLTWTWIGGAIGAGSFLGYFFWRQTRGYTPNQKY
jgi:hypothetical protein